MIRYVKGNMFDSDAAALVNTVNLVGVMGKGVALQFKQRYPDNYKAYRTACRQGLIGIGRLFVTKEPEFAGERIIVNFPTKTDWRQPSEYAYIESGLMDLRRLIELEQIPSIALPPLGAGNGGLNWPRVRGMIESALGDMDADIIVYEPNDAVVEHMKSERIPLTDARALLLYMLFNLVRNGEFVSEFSSEKVCYFLQRFGAGDLFRLEYKPYYYGPYSGKVRYVLNALNGSYIMGYSAMDKKPFEPLSLVADSYDEICRIIDGNARLKDIAARTAMLLEGFYSDYGLELLSSIDYIQQQHGRLLPEDVSRYLAAWSDRKHNLFSDMRVITLALNHLNRHLPPCRRNSSDG